MTAFEWIALVGAAAWVPQIAFGAYKLFVRPKVTLIPGPIPEIGYSLLGPVFNVTCAFAVSRKDAIVQRMTARISHANGESRLLTWALLNETFSEIRSETGERAEFAKRQPALALKVSTSLLTEKLVGFQDFSFQEQRAALANDVISQHSHHEKTEDDKGTAVALTLKSKAFSDFLDYYHHNQFWKVGAYTTDLAIYLLNRPEPIVKRVAFDVTPDTAERIASNLVEIRRVAEQTVRNPPPDERIDERWNWANPQLRVLSD